MVLTARDLRIKAKEDRRYELSRRRADLSERSEREVEESREVEDLSSLFSNSTLKAIHIFKRGTGPGIGILDTNHLIPPSLQIRSIYTSCTILAFSHVFNLAPTCHSSLVFLSFFNDIPIFNFIFHQQIHRHTFHGRTDKPTMLEGFK
jgi:hypothetical protein